MSGLVETVLLAVGATVVAAVGGAAIGGAAVGAAIWVGRRVETRQRTRNAAITSRSTP